MKEAQIIKAYEAAKERYAQIGIDTGEALKKLQNIFLNIHSAESVGFTQTAGYAAVFLRIRN